MTPLFQDRNRSGIVLALIGALLFSTKAVWVKLAYLYQVDSITLLFLRMTFALPFYLIALLSVRKKTWQNLRELPWYLWLAIVVASTVGYYLSSLLDFLGLQYIDASIERLILFMYPTFIAIMAFLFFGERLSRKQALALLTSYLGLMLVFGEYWSDFSLDSNFWRGALLIFACAITFAIFLIMSQWLLPSFGVSVFTPISMIIACLFVGLHYGFVEHRVPALDSLATPVLVYALLMALLATVVPSYIVNMAIARIGAVRTAIISSVGPFSTIALAAIFLGESLSAWQFFGAFFIVGGVTLVSMERKSRGVGND